MSTAPPTPARHARFGRDRFLYAAGHRHHLVEAGHGPSLVLLPGALETYRTFHDVLPRLAQHFRCLALDLLGQGDSDSSTEARYDVPAQADRVVAVLDGLDVPRAYVLGTGLGGSIALNLAGRHPGRVFAAVSVDGLAGVPPGARGPLDYLGALAANPVLGVFAEKVARTGLLALPLVRAQLRGRWSRVGWSERFQLAADLRVTLGALRRETMAEILEAHRKSRGLEEAARAITLPVLHLAGQRSAYRHLMGWTWEILGTAPGVACFEVLEVGTAMHIERPAWLAETAAAFLRAGSLPRGRASALRREGVPQLAAR